MRFTRRWLRDCEGAAAVEAALTMPLLLMVMAGLIDGSRAVVQSMKVRAASEAGAAYARLNGWDSNGIKAAANAATGMTVTTTPQQLKGCTVGGTFVLNTGVTCVGGTRAPGSFVKVTVEAPFTPLMPWPGLSYAPKFTSSALVRIG
jgi:Flp pilus assembly protein TadG